MKISITIAMTLLAVSAVSAGAADAKKTWANNCASCHGPDGSAGTKMGKILQAKDLSSSKVQSSFTDAQAATAIKEGIKEGGKTRMPSFAGKLSSSDIKALVTYVRTLKK